MHVLHNIALHSNRILLPNASINKKKMPNLVAPVDLNDINDILTFINCRKIIRMN